MLIRSGIIVATLTLISRIFGLVRELFIAAMFGSSYMADCVTIAFRLPNLFRRVFGEGALSAVFVPIFNEKLSKSTFEACEFSSKILSSLLIFLIILTLIMQIMMPYVMAFIAPGFHNEPQKYSLAVLLCRITTPYLIFISITAILGGMLNSMKKFTAFACTPIIMNICLISSTYFFSDSISPPIAISGSLFVAGIIQVIFMYYCLLNAKLSLRFSISFHDHDVNKLLKNMGPAAMGSGIQQVNLFISQSIASFIPGAVAVLSYADRLYQLPLSLLGATFSTILLPELSRIYQRKDLAAAQALQSKAIMIALLIALPSMAGLIILAKPIIQLIYQRGAFALSDTLKTAAALSAFALGLPAFVLSKILIPVFYANGDTKTPLRITIYSLTVNVALNILLMVPFSHTGIAIGSSIAGWYNVYLLSKYTKKYLPLQTFTESIYRSNIYQIILSTSVMAMFLFISDHFWGSYFHHSETWLKITCLLANITVAIAVYIGMLYACRIHLTLSAR